MAEPQELVRYWGTDYDWRKIVGPLTGPTAFGRQAEDAFDVVIPSLPGFGFSSRPTEVGWGWSASAVRGTCS